MSTFYRTGLIYFHTTFWYRNRIDHNANKHHCLNISDNIVNIISHSKCIFTNIHVLIKLVIDFDDIDDNDDSNLEVQNATPMTLYLQCMIMLFTGIDDFSGKM